MATTFSFGSITEEILKAHALVPLMLDCEEAEAPQTMVAPIAQPIGDCVMGTEVETPKESPDVFAEIYAKAKARMEAAGPQIVVKRRGCYVSRCMTDAELASRERSEQIRLAMEELEPKLDHDHIVDHIWVDEVEVEPIQPERRPIHCTRSQRIRSKPERVIRKSGVGMDYIVRSLKSICAKKNIVLELIARRRKTNYLVFNRYKGRVVTHAVVAHMLQRRQAIDFVENPLLKRFSHIFTTKWNADDVANMGPGTSGMIISVDGYTHRPKDIEVDYFIMRGKLGAHYIDARSRLNAFELSHIREFSNGDLFWKGFSEKFLASRPQVDHQCETNLKVVDCGEVAGLVTQALHPCGRITCKQCITQLKHLTRLEYGDLISSRVDDLIEVIRKSYDDFGHIINVLQAVKRALTLDNTNVEASNELYKIIGDRTTEPFVNVQRINTTLMRCGTASAAEFAEASDDLLKVAQFLKNRTDVIASNDIKHFRNKRSAKTHFNADLMCDNQLDRNGNFVWGERGYHAKRFLKNYFDIIEPADGYGKYVSRPNRNGFRKLAIGKLIVSTNLETFRAQMRGEVAQQCAITEECISRRNGSYYYPGCCVTTDDGSPLESELELPTKHHLVVGNMGDPKYVGMPQDPELKMYISKNGYCYINIFFAMLINVNENEAKAFTKMVRDVLIPKLGEWPSVVDVATACNLLSIFYPDTRSAELPRMLVDHITKTVHVLDSFGSVSIGYHILKANTVNQFMQLAQDNIISPIKQYTVGGIKSTEGHSCIQMLIRSVYRPKVMREIMMAEPYILVMSLVSPSILLALFNSGSLEMATHLWIRESQSITQIMMLLSILAAKVSFAKTLRMQLALIEENAGAILHTMNTSFEPYHSVYPAQALLCNIIETRSTNEALIVQGFETMKQNTLDLVEKSYAIQLEDSWGALSLCEKLSVTWRSHKLRREYSQYKELKNETGLSVRCATSVTASLGLIKHRSLERIKVLKRRAQMKVKQVTGRFVCACFSGIKYAFPDLVALLNTLAVVSLIIGISTSVHKIAVGYMQMKQHAHEEEDERKMRIILRIHASLKLKLGELPTFDEFQEYLDDVNPELGSWFRSEYNQDKYQFQQKSDGLKNLEKIVAFTALVVMLVDAERSDGVFKIMNKLKGIISTATQDPMRFQSLDDVQDITTEKNLTIDFDLDSENPQINRLKSTEFEEWWSNQLMNNNVIPHYRTEGRFMEFTRATAALVANEIAHGSHKDILVRGAVGSGKSTGLPFHLSSRGKVLLLEPTKPLAENVCKQLRKEPFNVSPTLRMRGTTIFGSTPIIVMTSGFALHYYANNVAELNNISFIIFDECHVHDANAMAFRCLLQEYTYSGSIIKMSATPPGRETEFATQKPVTLKVEENLSHSQFVQQLGTGANSDVLQDGDNILIYVASYNEIDSLSKMLLESGHKVTKVDGRTMKNGCSEIETMGTREKKHFIVATNIIENGVTLDIDVVVDFGCKVSPELDVDARMVRYRKVSISYGERIQRLGRVGRHKNGTALRIGATEKGLQKVPEMVATEAAFYCFAYGLPVMTEGVTTSLLAHCTVLQARSMLQFELSIFFMFHFVRFDGSMHAAIHDRLKHYKLRDSEMVLTNAAIPSQSLKTWPTVREFNLQGQRLELDDDIRLPFYARDIPEKLIKDLYTITMVHRKDAGFGRLTSVSAAKIAYTLQTDPMSVQRTIAIIDKLIERELTKQAYFANITSSSCSSSNFTLTSIVNAIRARHVTDHTAENIIKLQAAKGQLLEFRNINADLTKLASYEGMEALETLTFQSEEAVSNNLDLKGHWNASLVTSDLLIVGSVLVGGACLVYNRFKQYVSAPYEFQGKSKRHRQKIGFRDARDIKYAREVYGDDACIEQHFGSAYTKKGKGRGTTKGMGSKSRRFYNMYGFDPTDYTFARYVDPLTGKTLDEQTITDITLIQSHFGDIRQRYIDEGLLDINAMGKGIEAYFVKDGAKQLLKIDLTPHNPLQIGRQTASIAGHPDRDRELRQTGPSKMLPLDTLPDRDEEVEFETKSTFNGVRDYNPIASVVCQLKNSSDGYDAEVHGIGYGSVIITNQHLFRRNNGELRVWSHHGEFLVRNTTELKMYPIDGRDILLIRMPKDFPPFPRKIRFRKVQGGERVVLVGSNFQEKFISSIVSESSVTSQSTTDSFVKHWISTKEGHCGLPLVSPKDGFVVGLHSLASTMGSTNMFTGFTDNFESDVLAKLDTLDWTKSWKLNVDLANWGVINIKKSQPVEVFNPVKECSNLDESAWQFQHKSAWLLEKLHGNLRPMAHLDSALVTKHVVKGKCPLFHLYLELTPEAKTFFTPLMGAYQKSLLNKEAYMKDLFKYAGPVIVGDVKHQLFEMCVNQVIQMLVEKGMTQCEYITDEDSIFQALNMKAAVGALYKGKKRDYFDGYTDTMKEDILRASCFRLYTGKMGIWNGSLKAELRTAEKVAQNKTRTFTAAPIDTLLGGKVCVDDFNNKFYELNNKIPSSVGMTKFYGGWNDMLQSLPDGWILCDADGSQFDSSLSPYLINAVLQIRLHFNEEWDIGEQMLRNLYTEIVYTPISTPDGTVIKKFRGNNSGQPSTVVDNTLMVIIAVYYAIRLAGCNDDIEEYIKFVVNGDDLLIAIRPDKEWLLDTFANAFKSLGLNYDFGNRHTNKEDVWFMSHRGIKRNGIYIPKLEEERIVSILEWDRANEPEHRLEAICASMIEAWGYDELLGHIRKFYYWLLGQAPYSELSATGKAPFISEVALTALYTGEDASESELERYLGMFNRLGLETQDDEFTFQSGNAPSEVDAGRSVQRRNQGETSQTTTAQTPDQDVNAGTVGTFTVPRIKTITSKLNLPKVRGKSVVNLDHLLGYDPDQTDISNTRSTHAQFDAWYEGVKNEYDLDDQQMQVVLNGLMVWCIENGTSPNINGTWTMMDGDTQVEYPLQPIIANAQPTLRQIMAHFSSLAEAYIEKRNLNKPYMPRYGLQRNLNDISLARYAFDFYELTSKTPSRAREAHIQMKAAALQTAKPKLFGLDGNVGTTDEDTERHVTTDVNRHMHSMLGVRM